MLAHILQLSRIQLYTQFDRPLTEIELAEFKALLKQRCDRKPLAYLLGKKEFYSMDFYVDESVLIPRTETEMLVDETLRDLSPLPGSVLQSEKEKTIHILEIGTGSGCIAITLAKHLPKSKIVTVDISPQALEVAKKNAEKHQVSDQIIFKEADFLDANFSSGTASFDYIVSNPPYIPKDDISKLEPELHQEPLSALDGGRDGLDFYRKLLPWSQKHLAENGTLLLEIGFNQGKDLEELALKNNFSSFKILKDLAGQDRVFKGKINHG